MADGPIPVEQPTERAPMLYTDAQREVYAALNNEVIVAKADLADAIDAVEAARKKVAESEATLHAYSRTMLMERRMPGAWTPTPTALIPK